jgi:hypothetical protein
MRVILLALEMVEMAIALAPENKSAWSYKANMLLELSKLAEMSGDRERKTMLTKEYDPINISTPSGVKELNCEPFL